MSGAARPFLRAVVAAPRRFHTSSPRPAPDAPTVAAAPLPPRKPMGAFRGGLFGFLFGCVLSGGGAYSYVLQEYKASNDLLTEDIYTLQAAVTRLTSHVKSLEDRTQSKK